MFAVAWPELGHEPANFHGQQPPNANPLVPPGPMSRERVTCQVSVQVRADTTRPSNPSKTTRSEGGARTLRPYRIGARPERSASAGEQSQRDHADALRQL
jgi:hypothetical protein